MKKETEKGHPGRGIDKMVSRQLVRVQPVGDKFEPVREKGRPWLMVTKADGRRLHG